MYGERWVYLGDILEFVDEVGCYKMVEIKYEMEVFGLSHRELGTAY